MPAAVFPEAERTEAEDSINKSDGDKGTMSPKTHKRLSVEELRRIVKPLAEKYGVDRIYLFGSMARGDGDDNSDYDFCIESAKMRSLLELSGFFRELKEAIGAEIDIVEKEALKGEFLNAVISEGIELYAQ
jgi:predicted nucleotidyltransferase